MERGVSQEQVRREKQEQNLYGANLFQSGEHDSAEVETYIATQEKTHLAEGLELQQRTIRRLPYIDGQVRGFGGQPMTEVNQSGYLLAKNQYLSGDEAAYILMHRRGHDITITERDNELMGHGKIGDGFMIVTPYEEEQDEATARRLGFWPEYRRSYVWFHRKISETELECVDLSIDQSSVATYKSLLSELGLDLPDDIQSHDIPAYGITFTAESEQARDELIDNVKGRYRALNNDPSAKQATDGFEAVEYLEKNAHHYIKLLIDMHRAVAETRASGNLHELIRLSSSQALKKLNCLDPSERQALNNLLHSPIVTEDHTFALSTLVSAQRYGIWQSISEQVGGAEEWIYPAQVSAGVASEIYDMALIDHVYGGTNQAAAEFKTKPGCDGGTSFLQQNEAEVKSSIFGGEKYVFNKKMYCVVCQAPPKEKAKPKWCGPCGICRTCDGKLQAKNSWLAA
jgi:hypothetical protein